jgi:hypothetical protein
MNAPRPLLSDPTALGGDPSLARALLESGRDVSPPAGAKAELWSRLEATLAAGASASSVSAGASEPMPSSLPPAAASPAKSGTGSLVTKLGLAGIIVGGALVAATFARAPSAELTGGPTPNTTQLEAMPPGVRLPPIEMMPEAARDLPQANPRETVLATATPAEPNKTTSKPNPLREVEGVRSARAKLAAGDAAGALEELAALDREIEKGVLGQERQVLAIESLAASGQRERAGKLAKAFIAASPDSPYANRLAPLAAP